MSQRYKVQHRYGANRDGKQFGPWQPGEVIELQADEAEWINRDSADTLAEVDGEPVGAPVEIVAGVLADEAEVAAAVEDAVRQALTGAEQQRLAELDVLQAQARALVTETADDPDSESTGRVRELAADLVAGVGPERAAGLAVLASLFDDGGSAEAGQGEPTAAPSTEATTQPTPVQPVEEKPAAEAKAKAPRRSGK